MAPADRLGLTLATGLGLGYAPFAPGTVGSLAALPLAWGLWRLAGPTAVLAAAVAATILGLWACGPAIRHFARADPGPVVLDEIAGMLLALVFLPPSTVGWLAAFLLFRLFDVWKPYPIRRLESLPGPSGIMADDLLAGLLANGSSRLILVLVGAVWELA